MPAGWEDVRPLADDAESGAVDIGRRAAEAIAALPRSGVTDAVRALIRGHPSMAPLWRLGDEVLSSNDHAAAARRYAELLRAEVAAVAAVAAGVLPDEVVTHSFSGTLVAVVAAAGARARCARSDPGGEGQATVDQLRRRGVDAVLVEDAEAAARAAGGTAVVVGADAVGPGGVVNKVGTGALAEAAGAGEAAAFVVAGSSKLIGADLPAPDPFERVPVDRFTAMISDRGTLPPADVVRAAAERPPHAALRDLL